MGLLLIRYALGCVLPMGDITGSALPMRDVALVRYVWGSRMHANEMRMGTNGLWDDKPMIDARDFKPDRCGSATCRAGSPNPAANVAGVAA